MGGATRCLIWLTALLSGIALVSCSGGTSEEGDGPARDVVFDFSSHLDALAFDVVDDLSGPRPDVKPVGNDASFDMEEADEDILDGAFGAPCLSNAECMSGFCVSWDEGWVCTELCIDDCPQDWSCRSLPQSYPDPVFVCYPGDSTLCRPCGSSAACGDGFCVAFEDGERCTRSCTSYRPCPEGYDCVETEDPYTPGLTSEQCVPHSGACDCMPINYGESRICGVENQAGVCWGQETCADEAGWSECSARTPVLEICNGGDDDCNGYIDEALTDEPGTVCEVTNEHGTCVDHWRCMGSDGWVCAARNPAEEACDYLDNDCDGDTDEDFRNEADLYTDDHHCSVCGNDCAGRFPNATSSCFNDTELGPRCVIDECATGFYRAGELTCLPVATSLCNPCVTDANCVVPGDLCLPLGEGSYCGRNCAPGSVHGEQCPEGYACEQPYSETEPEVFQCIPETNSCDCTAGNTGAEQPCAVANEYGQCFGVRICSPPDGWALCDAPTPAMEICNGVDDDCDGLVDEGVVAPAEACETTWTDPDTSEIEVCAGGWACVRQNDSAEWRCSAPQAGPEQCDHIDNDCDGVTDEPFVDPDSGRYTDLENCGMCGFSCVDLIPNAEEVACAASDDSARCVVVSCAEGFYLPAGLDSVCVPVGDASDCTPCGDDSHCESLPGRCILLDGLSVCASTCSSNEDCEDGFDCVDESCVPQSGSCTCLAANADDTRACFQSSTFGTCAGTQSCLPELGWSDCDAVVPGREICDGVDNNCNGLADDGVSPPEPSCQRMNEQGACDGAWICTDAGEGVTEWVCSAAEPALDICDYLDNDCDGLVDGPYVTDGLYLHPEACGACGVTCLNALPNATATCGVLGDTARCVVDTCDEGFVQVDELTCVPATNDLCRPCSSDAECPTPGDRCVETDEGSFCGYDCGADNAHGSAEGECPEGFGCLEVEAGVRQCRPLSGVCSCLPANDGAERVCVRIGAAGTCYGAETCDGALGWVGCDANTPSAETCDGVDNDCNALVDDLPGRGDTCSNDNAFGSCPGIFDCIAESEELVCVGSVPSAELCDYLDNDCQNGADDGFEDLYDPCTTGVGLCQRIGFRECNAEGDATVCNASAGEAQIEQCNGLDDDCDGDTDNGWPELGTTCSAGEGLCHRTGLYVCDGSNPTGDALCNAEVVTMPDGESACDYQDEDCDGEVDEDFKTDGVYAAASACGGCGIDCNNFYTPALNNAVAECDTSGETPRCDFHCTDALHVDADGIPDNGCELEIDPNAVYVSTPANGGSDVAGCGAWDAPLQRHRHRSWRLRARARIGRRVSRVNRSGGGHQRTRRLQPDELVQGLESQPDRRLR